MDKYEKLRNQVVWAVTHYGIVNTDGIIETLRETVLELDTDKLQNTSSRAKKPAVKTFEPIRKENKSKKLLLLLKPTLFDRLQAKAQEYEISTNELINQILENNV